MIPPHCRRRMIKMPIASMLSEHAVYLRLFLTNGGGW
jgi:hypothetical protein